MSNTNTRAYDAHEVDPNTNAANDEPRFPNDKIKAHPEIVAELAAEVADVDDWRHRKFKLAHADRKNAPAWFPSRVPYTWETLKEQHRKRGTYPVSAKKDRSGTTTGSFHHPEDKAVARKAENVESVPLLVFDVETGFTIERAGAALSGAGLEFMIEPSINHMTTKSLVTEKKILEFAGENFDITPEDFAAVSDQKKLEVLRAYFGKTKAYEPWLLDSFHAVSVDFADGKHYLAHHAPMHRFHIVLPLSEEFVLMTADAIQSARQEEYTERYFGFAAKHGLPADPACGDCCRMMYNPGRWPDSDAAEFYTRISPPGRPVFFDDRDAPRLKSEKKARVGKKPKTSAEEIPSHLKFWMACGGSTMEYAVFRERELGVETISGGSGGKYIQTCPNEGEHTPTEGVDTGFMCMNASESDSGRPVAHCQHTCKEKSGGDFLWFLKKDFEALGILDDKAELARIGREYCNDFDEEKWMSGGTDETTSSSSIEAVFAAFEDHVNKSKSAVAQVEAAAERARKLDATMAEQRRQLGKLEDGLGKLDENVEKGARKAKVAARKRDEQQDKAAAAADAVAEVETALRAKLKKGDKAALETRRVKAMSALEREKGAAARSAEEASELEADAVAAAKKAEAVRGDIDELGAAIGEADKEAHAAREELAKAKAAAADLDKTAEDNLRASLCRLIAGVDDGVAFDGYMRRLATATGEKEMALRATIKAERKTLDDVRTNQTTTDRNGLERDHNGRVIGNEANIRRALDLMKVKVRFNEFTGMSEIEGLPKFGPLLSDAAMNRLRLRSEGEFGLKVPKDYFYDVVDDHARSFEYHPVRDYLAECQAKWDGVARVDKWLVTYAGAEDTRLNNAVGRCHLIGAARRIRTPGTKHDESLIFESPQGQDKSTFFETLAVNPEWYGDSMQFGQSAQKTIEDTVGIWIMEIAELSGMRGNEIEKVKAHMSRKKDKARAAYGRIPQVVPRSYIAVGSTNDNKYLKDQTGNRRFWPVSVTKLDVEALKRDLDQLWGEVATLEAKGASNRLAPELWADAAKAQNARKVLNPFSDKVDDLFGDETGRITCRDAYDVLGLPAEPHQSTLEKVTEAMSEVGWVRSYTKVFGKTKRCFVREVAGEPCPLYTAARIDGKAQLALVAEPALLGGA